MQVQALEEASLPITNHHTSTGVLIPDIDPFLFTICTLPLTKRWHSLGFFRRDKPLSLLPSSIVPFSALDIDNQLQECDTYSVRDDFPILGARLLILQHYNMRQQPSKMKDIWQDSRNPLQWYTLRAVTWIGGVIVILAVLKVLVGVAQVYLTARS